MPFSNEQNSWSQENWPILGCVQGTSKLETSYARKYKSAQKNDWGMPVGQRNQLEEALIGQMRTVEASK